MGRDLPSWKKSSKWEGSFLVGREIPMVRELPGEKRASRHGGKVASRWEENFPVEKELPSCIDFFLSLIS